MNVHDGRFESIDHTADLGYVCRAQSLAGLFENCGVSLAAMMFGTERQPAPAGDRRSVAVEAESVELLLVRFLNEILFLWETHRFVPTEVDVEGVTTTHVSAHLRGERYDPARHDVLADVKAATYHMLQVEEQPDGWTATVIFDV